MVLALICRYSLVSVVVHRGHSVHSGHYTAFVKSPSNIWHLCDDSRVHVVKPTMVLNQPAYILVYVRQQPRRWLLPDGQHGPSGRVQAPSHGQPTAGADGLQTRASAYPRVSSACKQPDTGGGGSEEAGPSGMVRGGNAAAVADAQQGGSTAAAAHDRQHGAKADSGGAQGAHDDKIVSTSTPVRNGRVSAAVAYNLNCYGRGTKRANQLMRNASKVRKKTSSASPEKGRSADSPAVHAAAQARAAGGAAPAAGSKAGQPAAPEGPSISAATPVDMAPATSQAAAAQPLPAPAAAAAGQRGAAPAASTAEEPQLQPPLARGHGARRIYPGKDDLLQGAGHHSMADLGTWDDVDQNDARLAQQAVQAALPKRHHVDVYDADYDRGKIKKVKRKDAVAVGGPGAAAFHEAAVRQRAEQAPARHAPVPRKRNKTRVGAMRSH